MARPVKVVVAGRPQECGRGRHECLRHVILCVLFVMAAAVSAAQDFPLESVRVEGNQRISREKILALAGLKIGQPLVKADFDAARDRLLATGAFESVGYEFKPSAAKTGYDGVLQLVEVSQLYPYRFEDLPRSDDELRAALRKQEPLLGDQIPGTKEVLDRYEKALTEAVGGKVQISGKLNADIPGQLMIVFRPPTTRRNVAEVHFTGNDVLPAALLMNGLAGVAVGVPYSETTLRVLLDSSIRPLYEARGRFRVSFPRITVEPAKDVDGVSVTVAVVEGESYSLGSVRFAGVPASKAEELLDAANLKKNDVANLDDVKAAVDRIYDQYHREGYRRVTARIDRDIHDKERTVDVLVTIDTGPQYTLGKLEIVGLDITSEPVIRKMWAIKEGRPFDPAYPDKFLKEVHDEDLFDNLGKTRAETQVNEKTNTVDVTLYFPPGEDPQKKTGPRRP